MNPLRKKFLIFLLLMFVVTQSGCSLLQIPFTIVGESLKLVGKVLDIVGKLPKPPPGVIPGVF